jgi:Ni/Co efflux regulator RcnB
MKTLSSMIVGLALLAGGASALADPGHDHGNDHGRDQNARHGRDDRDDRHDRGGRYDRDDRHDGYWDRRPVERRYYSDRYSYGPRHWQRGGRYDGPMVIVNDYRYYRLSPPPYGYRWVRDDRSYLLVSIGDNMILDMSIR